MRKITLTKGKSIFIIDLILIPVFLLLIYSGVKLHVAGHTSNHDLWEYWALLQDFYRLLSEDST